MVVAVVTLASTLATGRADATIITPPALPRATCRASDIPERGLQGRLSPDDISSGYARNGITCNTDLVGRFGEKGISPGAAGGLKVLRYVDGAGHECAYYDTAAAVFLLNTPKLATTGVGVYVLDMSDPEHPKKTANLTTPAMLSPHESLNLNQKRGLLAAVSGFGLNPGLLDVYDLTTDCRNPILKSTTPFGIMGHEGNFSPDGNTFWTSSGGACWTPATLSAIDISNPSAPKVVWTSGRYRFHGLSISDDGTRLYGADLGAQVCDQLGEVDWGLKILDVSQVQARATVPVVVKEVSLLSWDTWSVPQMTIPILKDGHPYLVEIDEYARGNANGDPTAPVGAARIIDIADELHPSVISDIRLEVHQPENIAAIAGDPGASSPFTGYSGHYCAVPSRHDPDILACSFQQSGLRIFDIRDVRSPKEIAYFNSPVPAETITDDPGHTTVVPIHSPLAWSGPAFAPGRHEVWYSDVNFGFFVVRIADALWP
jgi:hypothetical protein